MECLPTNDNVDIREVWDDNLEHEVELIRGIVNKYPYIAMDTEFPGTVVKARRFQRTPEQKFRILKANVDQLKLIQLGLTFANDEGKLPTCPETGKYCVWQFNFREFNVDVDISAPESIRVLRNSGIDFKKNIQKGVDFERFAQLLALSGVVLSEDVCWLVFHGASDFAYLLKVLMMGKKLPGTLQEFLTLIREIFGNFYDVKHLIKCCGRAWLPGGLEDLAARLGVERVGTAHQAGSDSLLTCCTFFELKKWFFQGDSHVQYAGTCYGFDL